MPEDVENISPRLSTDNAIQNAAHEVINITELLEGILLNVPIRTLAHSRRTCRVFMQTIASSQSLRTSLFIDKDAKSEDAIYLDMLAPNVTIRKVNSAPPTAITTTPPVFVFNPLVFRSYNRTRTLEDLAFALGRGRERLKLMRVSNSGNDERDKVSFQPPLGFFRNMYLTRPSAPEVTLTWVHKDWPTRWTSSTKRFSVRNNTGVTVDDIARVVRDEVTGEMGHKLGVQSIRFEVSIPGRSIFVTQEELKEYYVG